MKLILLSVLAGLGLMMSSCQTMEGDEDGAAQGISGEGMGMNRESIYKMQDRTFRQLAY